MDTFALLWPVHVYTKKQGDETAEDGMLLYHDFYVSKVSRDRKKLQKYDS